MQRYSLTVENSATVAAQAALLIASGGVVLHPTDTVYGLACDATHAAAVDRVMRMKRRPQGVPFIVLVENIESAEPWFDALTAEHIEIMSRCRQAGAVTFVVRSSDLARKYIVGCGETIAVRIPDDPFCEALCRFAAVPVLSTSANVHGQPVPTSLDSADPTLCEQVDLVIDGGARGGTPSTIVELEGSALRILRDGGVSRSALEQALSPEFSIR